MQIAWWDCKLDKVDGVQRWIIIASVTLSIDMNGRLLRLMQHFARMSMLS